MFFIFGSPRSGTTLLAQCLSAHPDLVVPAETDFIVPAAFVFECLNEGQLLASIDAHCERRTPMFCEPYFR